MRFSSRHWPASFVRIVLAVALLLPAYSHAQRRARAIDMPRSLRTFGVLELDVDSAASITQKLGPAPTTEVRAGHDRTMRWCYRPNDGKAVVLELFSDVGEMATDGHELTVIQLTRPTAQTDTTCVVATMWSSNVDTIGKLRLGMRAEEVIRAQGAPTRRSRDSLVYEFSGRQYMKRESPEYAEWNTPQRRRECFNGGPPFSWVAATLSVALKEGRANALRVERYDQATC